VIFLIKNEKSVIFQFNQCYQCAIFVVYIDIQLTLKLEFEIKIFTTYIYSTLKN